jgi:capsular polysaccharide biosynthesis protein
MSRERRIIAARDPDGDGSDRLWVSDEDFTESDDWFAEDAASRLTTITFIGSALRRRMRLWVVTALAGLLLGIGAFVLIPPLHHATTTILVTQNPNEDPLSAMQTDEALAVSRTVAQRALRSIGTQESVDTFLSSYSAVGTTDRVLTITVGAKSDAAAIRGANAVAKAFTDFRKQQVLTQQQLVTTSLNQQLNAAQQNYDALVQQLNAAKAEPRSPAQRAKVAELTSEQQQAQNDLVTTRTTVQGSEAQASVTAQTMIKGTQVIDAATAAKYSSKRLIAFYAATGLIAGLVIGMGWVIVSALLSSRLRRRDDIAHALGAPVRLSVRSMGQRRRLLPQRGGQDAATERDLRMFALHLHEAALWQDAGRDSRGAATLAVVAIENEKEAAQPLVSLALSCAQEGDRVVLADLVQGSPAAGLLEAVEPGIRMVNVDGAHVAVVIPAEDDLMPTGPLPATAQSQQPASSEALITAYKSADLLITLVSLDPTVGAGHLATWATGAVAVVTAGRSTSERIRAVGEMVRLSGIPLLSAVVIGADRTDESVGLTYPKSPQPGGPDLGIIRS